MKIKRARLTKQLTTATYMQNSLLIVIVALAYAFRAHPYLLKPQLYAEDGATWLAQGYNNGFSFLFHQVNGFLHVPERLFGIIVAFISLEWAPLIFAVAAWALFILTTYYLLSARTKILTNNYERLLVVASLCLVANLHEFFFNLSNSAFLLGIISTLILIAERPKRLIVDIAEKILFLLSCFCLPFAWFLLPIALFEKLKYKARVNFFIYASAAGTLAQVFTYLTSHVHRSSVTIFTLFSKYTLLEIYNQMLIPGIRLARVDMSLAEFETHHYQQAFVYLSILALVVAAIAVIRRSNRQVLYLLFFLAAMTFASLKSPTIKTQLPIDAIKNFAVVNGGSRYFVYGILATNLILAKASYQFIAPKARYIFLLFFVAFGLLSSWHYQSFYINRQDVRDLTSQYNSGLRKLRSGAKRVDIKENPAAVWHIVLVNR